MLIRGRRDYALHLFLEGDVVNRKEHIFIADDDRDLLALLAKKARDTGLTVDTARDAMTALQRIDETRPDLVILDVKMPGGNGLSVREMMAEHEDLSRIPVIILTGCSDEGIVRRCHDLCTFFVPKCPDVWSRIHPLLTELLDLEDEKARQKSPGILSTRNLKEQLTLVDSVFSHLGDFGERAPDDPYVPETAEADDKLWVLCIDDDTEFSKSLSMRLQKYGIELWRASAGMQGYQYAFTNPAFAVILDYHLPNGNGEYILRRLKETPATSEIPVIVLTGNKDRMLEKRMLNMGAAHFLTKPCPWDTFWTVLQKYLPSNAMLQHLPK